ncbi:GGDEF domain-containing protein [Pokkaliibacter sp. MBI-7]|uniref:GGDEF domain-containing protein n=1 Tax=Pokkaliibacter sp. MBI-7 TaxID=3040600 RepID=UPI002449B422|nr:GGDEF domain-containing protein [Pokkaliibacter sp. MBI-7]MDH2435484.1 GGDEF domain-containing protein [Pokkaliibacter sp. MBI-7]
MPQVLLRHKAEGSGSPLLYSFTHLYGRWPLVRALRVISVPVALTCGLFSLLVLIGYGAGLEVLYRPVAHGPATHPLTAIVVLMISSGVAINVLRLSPAIAKILALLSLLLIFLRLTEIATGTDILSGWIPFQHVVSHDIVQGKSNSTGANTAITLMLLAFALLLSAMHTNVLAQLAASLAGILPMSAYTGYIYGIDAFHGAMSLVSATLALLLMLSILGLTAHRGVLRAVLSPYIGGRIARIQTSISYAVLLLVGYMIYRSLASSASVIGAFIVLVIWFTTVLICVSAVMQEKMDRKRRAAERALYMMATRDQLTGVYNRKTIMELAESELKRSQRSERPFYIVMLDVDHFKRINDQAGHVMGDTVLSYIGDLLGRCLRSSDKAGRYGGEEFIIMLTEVSDEGAARACLKLLNQVRSLDIPGWTDRKGPVTASIGYASSTGKQRLIDIIEAADAALYEAKGLGRDRVEAEASLPTVEQ